MNYKFYLVDQELLESSNGKILESTECINSSLYSGSLSDHIWHAETFLSFRDFIPESIREPIEKFINLFTSFGQLGHPYIFESACNYLREDIFIVMSKATQEEYIDIFDNCNWSGIEQLYFERYQKNNPDDNFEYFMECPKEMFAVLQYASQNEGVLVASF